MAEQMKETHWGRETARSDSETGKVLRIPAILVNRVSWKPNTW